MKTETQAPETKEFDRIIAEAQPESDLLEKEIGNLSESAKAFAERHNGKEHGKS